MGLALQHGTLKKIFLFIALLLGIAFQGAYSQSTLSPGDIAFTGFNGEGSASDDGFSVVIFKSIEANEEIHFSSKEWDGNTFAGSGGDLTWIAPSGGTLPGTVLVFVDVEGEPSVNIGSITDDADMNLSGSGDVIYAYVGTDKTSPDTPFLGAIASSSDLFNQPDDNEGTLVNTGLTEAGNETILLPDNIDNAEYIGDRDGNTPNVYRDLLNDITSADATDDNWDIYNGGDEAPFPPFNDQSFIIVSPPTVSFTTSKLLADEDGISIDLTVELVEANGTPVDVDVAFLTNSSTATNGEDFDNFTTETINFESNDGDGETKTVTIDLIDDSDFEGTEKAVFQLQNNTEGTIIEPSVLTLNIEDNDAPDVVINEILYDPDGDANNDGGTNATDDEFVEFINNSGSDLDISGWSLLDGLNGGTERYTFPDGTVIPADGAFVVFSTPAVGTIFGGANLYSADGSLSLNNGGDDVILEDDNGNEITSVTYDGSESEESITRNPDITGSFEGHKSADDGSAFSPGTKVNDDPFGSKHAIGIRGSEGWRMISSPVQNATFGDFFGDFWMQGVSGSNDDSQDANGTIFYWDESGGAFTAPTNMSDNLDPGKGYIVYFFEDDDNNASGIQGGFPKVISTDKTENGTDGDPDPTVSISATDLNENGNIDNDDESVEGWNLLGNPFDTDISVAAVIDILEGIVENEEDVNTNIHVWDHDADGGNDNYIELNGSDSSDDTIAPFQAFFVRITTEVENNITFSKSDLEANTGTEFYKNDIEDVITFDLQLHGEQYFDTYSLEFSENGTTELDRYDAYKLFSLNPNSISLFSTQSSNRLQKNALPIDLESRLEIPLSFDANGRSSLTFRWDEGMENIPNEWDLILIDNEQNREIDLRRDNEYSFTVTADQQEESKTSSDKKGLLNKSKVTQDSRFTLSVQPNIQGDITSDLPESVKLKPNYPNPFNPTTTIPYELTEDSDVLLTVWNMIGQKVATLVDGTVEAGTHEVNWNASDMPSGMYIARFEVNATVFTRKMTLIK